MSPRPELPNSGFFGEFQCNIQPATQTEIDLQSSFSTVKSTKPISWRCTRCIDEPPSVVRDPNILQNIGGNSHSVTLGVVWRGHLADSVNY